MEYTFVKLTDTQKTNYNWCLKISDTETLTLYEKQVISDTLKECLTQTRKSLKMFKFL